MDLVHGKYMWPLTILYNVVSLRYLWWTDRRGSSGVARLGHTGECALATRGRAPPVQVYTSELSALIVLLLIANRAPNHLEIEQRSIATYIHRITSLIRSPYASLPYMWHTLHYDMVSEPTWEVIKFETFSRRACPGSPNASALHTEFRTNVVCPCCALASAMSWLRHCGEDWATATYYHSPNPTDWDSLYKQIFAQLPVTACPYLRKGPRVGKRIQVRSYACTIDKHAAGCWSQPSYKIVCTKFQLDSWP